MRLTRPSLASRCSRMCRALALLALMSISTMTQAESLRPIKQVVFLNPGYSTETFWAQAIIAASTTAESLGMHLEVFSARRNTDEFIRLGKQVLNRESPPDLLITTNNHGLAVPLIEISHAVRVPMIIIVNSLTPRQARALGKPLGRYPYWLGSVSPDHQQGGHDSMVALINRHDVLHGKSDGRGIALVGGLHDEATRLRVRGVQDALLRAPHLSLDRIFQANWSYEDAYRKVESYLRHQTDARPLRMIWAANDLMGIAAIDALKHNGLRPGKDVVVAGMGWTRAGVDHLRSGEMEVSAGGGALATAWSLVLLAAVQQGSLQARDIGTRYYTMGIALAGDPEAFLDRIPLEVLAMQPMDHLINEVATLPPDASPFLPMPAHAASSSSVAAPSALTAVHQGARRHAQ